MQLFYITNINGVFGEMSAEEARHCSQVLRKKLGDTITFVDGKGNWYKAIIDEISRKHCVVKIVSKQEAFEKRGYYLHLAIAPTKNINRFEWFLEKATEIGIDEVSPIFCEHSERTKIRMDRLEKITISAMKQSLKAYLPKLNEPQSFSSFIDSIVPTKTNRLIAHCAEDEKILLNQLVKKGEQVLILIGPEGDFSPPEIQLANEHGFRNLSLGNSRLRTETAGVIAAAHVGFLNF